MPSLDELLSQEPPNKKKNNQIRNQKPMSPVELSDILKIFLEQLQIGFTGITPKKETQADTFGKKLVGGTGRGIGELGGFHPFGRAFKVAGPVGRGVKELLKAGARTGAAEATFQTAKTAVGKATGTDKRGAKEILAETVASSVGAGGADVAVRGIGRRFSSKANSADEAAEKQAKRADEVVPEPAPKEVMDSLLADLETDPFELVESTNISVKRINKKTDVANFIDNVSKRKNIDAEIPDEQAAIDRLSALATENPGSDIDTLFKAVSRGKEQGVDTDVNLKQVTKKALAAGHVLSDHSQHTFERIKSGKASVDETKDLIETNLKIQTEAGTLSSKFGGSLLASFKTQAHPARAQKKSSSQIKKLVQNEKNIQEISDRLKRIDIADPEQVSRFFRDIVQSDTKEKVQEAWINALLFDPDGQTKNIAGSSLFFVEKELEKSSKVATYAMRVRVIGKPGKRSLGESKAVFFGTVQSLKEASRIAAKSFKTEISQFGADATELEVGKLKVRKIKGTKGDAVRLSGRLLQAADDYTKALTYRSELNASAFNQATEEGLEGAEKAARITEIVNNPTAFSNIQKKIPKGESRGTSTNYTNKILGTIGEELTAEGIERSSLSLVNVVSERRKRGKIANQEAAERTAREMFGSGMIATASIAVKEGRLTGELPGRPSSGERDAALAGGHQKYSINVNGNSFQILGLEPVASTLGMAADLQQMLDDPEGPIIYSSEAALVMAEAVGNNITSETYAQNLAKALEAAVNPDQGSFESLLGNTVSGFVPNITGRLAQGFDPAVGSPDGAAIREELVETLKDRIPAMRKGIAPVVDIWGNVLVSEDGVLERMFKNAGIQNTAILGIAQGTDALSDPIKISEIKEDPATKEVNRLIGSGLKISSLGKPGSNVDGLGLDSEEFARFQIRAGKMAYEKVSNVISHPIWTRIPDEQKAKLMGRFIKQSRNLARNEIRRRRFLGIDK